MNATPDTTETQPDDLADGIYRDQDGDLWLVKDGVAYVLTDSVALDAGLYDSFAESTLEPIGDGIDADVAHLAYVLRMLRAI
ncbi:hypothetical protein SEA_CARON_36 [Microbacterium phage Caron]|uniref:Uncharacterized protein n=1 Tax=Microbacterium phage Caron TaxID=3028494 RepID=A0AAE9ZP95_9CAUD|nr:hypothetical protein SEA_CARON_36 [Microbacterium phage Caron]